MDTKTEKKAPAVKKAPSPKASAPKAPAKAVAAKGGTLVVVQHGSTTGVKPGMRETLAGLGLGKPRARRTLEDTPAVRGMVRKVRHLVHIEGEKA